MTLHICCAAKMTVGGLAAPFYRYSMVSGRSIRVLLVSTRFRKVGCQAAKTIAYRAVFGRRQHYLKYPGV